MGIQIEVKKDLFIPTILALSNKDIDPEKRGCILDEEITSNCINIACDNCMFDFININKALDKIR